MARAPRPGEADAPAHGVTRHDFGPLAPDYERWYRTAEGKRHDRVQKADVRRLLPRTRPGARLLDVGCGTGHWSRFFAGCGYRVRGVDLSEAMIAEARGVTDDSGFDTTSAASAGPGPAGPGATESPAGCTYSVADAADLPFGDASFDVVAAMAVLEFVPDADIVVSEMARCTRPGGSLLVGTLNRRAALNRERLAAGAQPYAAAKLLTPGELTGLLARYGPVHMRASLPEPAGARETGDVLGPFLVAEVSR